MENKKCISLVFLLLFGILSFIAVQDIEAQQNVLPGPGQPESSNESAALADSMAGSADDSAADSSPESFSQAENLSYYIVETEEGVRFIQRIEWNSMEYIYRYEVIVEQRDPATKVFKEIVNESTEVNFIEISIPAGDYRYKVRVFNLLNKFDGESNWQEFEVFLAIQPQVDTFTPRSFYLDDETTTSITVTGKNFTERAEVFLVTKSVEGKTQATTRIFPAQKKIDPSGQGAEIIFNDLDLKTGIYDVVVQNPGGLKDSAGPFSIAFQKPVDFNVSIGWTPMKFFNLTSSSDTYYGVTNEILDFIYFFGLSGRITFIPIKKSFGYIGIELAPYGSYFSDKKSDGYTIEGFFVGAHVNLVYQKHFIKRKLVGNARLGGGISRYYDLKIDYGHDGLVSDALDEGFVSAIAGLSMQFFITKQLFLDFGAEYQHNFMKGMSTGLIRPGLFVGWQF